MRAGVRLRKPLFEIEQPGTSPRGRSACRYLSGNCIQMMKKTPLESKTVGAESLANSWFQITGSPDHRITDCCGLKRGRCLKRKYRLTCFHSEYRVYSPVP